MDKETIEKLAEIEHTRWADWQRWVHTKFIEYKDVKNPKEVVCLEREWVNRWDNQIQTNYKDLSEKERDSDRKQVKRYLPIIQNLLDKQREEIKEKIEKKLLKKIDKWTKRNKIKTTYYMDSELKDDIFKELNK